MHSVVICSCCCVMFVASSHDASRDQVSVPGWMGPGFLYGKMQGHCLMLQIG